MPLSSLIYDDVIVSAESKNYNPAHGWFSKGTCVAARIKCKCLLPQNSHAWFFIHWPCWRAARPTHEHCMPTTAHEAAFFLLPEADENYRIPIKTPASPFRSAWELVNVSKRIAMNAPRPGPQILVFVSPWECQTWPLCARKLPRVPHFWNNAKCALKFVSQRTRASSGRAFY